MGNIKHGAGIAVERVFQDFFGSDIQMVRRLVEDKEVGFRQHEFGKGNPAPFSAADISDALKYIFPGKEESGKRIADLGVDMLAAGIGNIHGKYPENWQGLSFETLDAVQQKTGAMPLVLHGGTGIPEDMIKKAISLGVAKINVNTECQLSFADATRKYIEAGKDLEGKGFDPRKLLAPGAEAIKATVKEKMELFGSVGKANA